MPDYNRDPRSDHNFGNHPYNIKYIVVIMENQMEKNVEHEMETGV